MNDEQPGAGPFPEYVARYAEGFGNPAWAESLRQRLAGTGIQPASPTSRKERSGQETDT